MWIAGIDEISLLAGVRVDRLEKENAGHSISQLASLVFTWGGFLVFPTADCITGVSPLEKDGQSSY